ncbi:MAG: GGDEF domain-containing protein [Pseudomonadales bacterium]
MTDQALPNEDQSTPPLCPVGENQCLVIDQAIALRDEVVQLMEQVRTDTLTGLFNFRHLRLALEQEMERTRRTDQSTALIMVDLDYFKRVNDNWGHEVGNQALVSTAEVIRQTTRRPDIPCRYGGEEFTVILPSTDLITGIQVAERIRLKIEQTPVLADGRDIKLTASFGVDIFASHQDDTPEQLIRRVDQSLYRAKESGRNCVCHGVGDIRSGASMSHEERDLLAGFFGDENSEDRPINAD